MNKLDYTLAVGTVRILETRLLNQFDFSKLQDCETIDQFIAELKSFNYEITNNIFNLEDFRAVLDARFLKIAEYLISICPADAPFNAVFIYNDFFNLRTILFANFFEFSYDNLILRPNFLPIDLIENCALTKSFDDMPIYFQGFAKQINYMLENNVDKSKILNFSNAYIFREKLNMFANNSFLYERTCLEIDLFNCKLVIRAVRMGLNVDCVKDSLITGSKNDIDLFIKAYEGGISELSRLFRLRFNLNFEDMLEKPQQVEDAMSSKLADFDFMMRRKPFGLEPVVGYLTELKIEHKRLQKILVNIL